MGSVPTEITIFFLCLVWFPDSLYKGYRPEGYSWPKLALQFTLLSYFSVPPFAFIVLRGTTFICTLTFFIQTLDNSLSASLKLTLSSQIVIKNSAGEQLAWVLAHQARKERKLLAQRENLLVPDNWTGVFSSPVKHCEILISCIYNL